ncbi:Mbov_0121 family peptidase domain-containing ABC transporter [Mycoplasmopsis sturni]|uniref:Mbov_0121 family peptidase domain-containing ABC transporter n=1 Tax=Mycoplasmopsis sturni TaxID=39047 RepID=UPI000568490D|nr:ATP-binding cassette domain-containing protein [Mycoplasmopsis sturni]
MMETQFDSRDCSLYVFKYFYEHFYNQTLDINDLKNNITYKDNGIALSDLKDFIQSYKLTLNAYHCDFMQLKNLEANSFPIGSIVKNLQNQHMVVILSLTDERIQIYDPLKGNINLTHQEFESKFLGILVTFEKQDIVQPFSQIPKEVKTSFKLPLNLLLYQIYYFCALILELLVFVSIPFLNKFVISEIIPNQSLTNIIIISFVFVWIILIESLFKHIITKILNHKLANVSIKIKEKLIINFKQTNYQELQQITSSEFVTRLFALDSYLEFKTYFICDIIINIIFFGIGLFLLYKINLTLLIVILIYAATLLIIIFSTKDKLVQIDKKVTYDGINLNNWYQELIDYQKHFVNTSLNEKISQKVVKIQEDYYQNNLINHNFIFGVFNFKNALEILGPVFILIFGTIEIWNDNLNLYNLIFFITGTNILLRPLKNLLPLVQQWNNFQKNKILLNFFNWESFEPTKTKQNDKIRKIEFSYLSFAYSKSDKNILNIRKMVIDQNLIILGKNGCGKTTLAGILSGNLKPQDGIIKINNIEVNLFQDLNLKGRIGYFGNNIPLNKTSVLEFLEIENNERFWEFIDNIELNFTGMREIMLRVHNSEVASLSSGEKQLLFFLKILLNDYELLILDEAFDNLSETNFVFVQKNLNKWIKNNLTIEISHNNRYIFPESKVIELEQNYTEI